MSRSLPPRPNLEHLKKQAKEMLDDLKKQNPSARLADAQYAIAREYGFASWPKLKAYVESLSDPERAVDVPVTVPQHGTAFVGKWTANLAKSRQHPSRQFQSATLELSLEGDALTLTDIVVEESGQQITSKSTILVDGKEHPSETENGYIILAKWGAPTVLDVLAKKDNQIVGWGTYEVSDDGKQLTITGEEQMIVLDHN